MIRKHGWLATSLVVAAVGGLDRPATGSGIASSWSGASASTYYDLLSASQQGATASASSSHQGIVTDSSGYPGGPTITVTTSGTVGATASGDPAHLLGVTASVNSGNPGEGYPLSAPDVANATASWSNDAVLVHAPAGSSLPDTIRLNFTLTFNDPGTSTYNTLTATFNGQTDQAVSQSGISFTHVNSSGENTVLTPSSLDSSNVGTARAPVGLKDTFHIDLPLSGTGLSAPFNLSLALNPQVGAAFEQPTMYDLTGNLALTSVTLPDGITTLASLGDSISFASGLTPPDPNPVPEPASLLGWALAFVATCRRVRSRRPCKRIVLAPGSVQPSSTAGSRGT